MSKIKESKNHNNRKPDYYFRRKLQRLEERRAFLEERIDQRRGAQEAYDFDIAEANALKTAIKCMEIVQSYYLITCGIFDDDITPPNLPYPPITQPRKIPKVRAGQKWKSHISIHPDTDPLKYADLSLITIIDKITGVNEHETDKWKVRWGNAEVGFIEYLEESDITKNFTLIRKEKDE